MSKLILIRGLPGSGKSTMAVSQYPDAMHLEADMYMCDANGVYTFDPSKLTAAHEWCNSMTRNYLVRGMDVVVTNTFVKHWEMQGYVDLAAELNVELETVVATGKFQNIHGVPAAVIERMTANWED